MLVHTQAYSFSLYLSMFVPYFSKNSIFFIHKKKAFCLIWTKGVNFFLVTFFLSFPQGYFCFKSNQIRKFFPIDGMQIGAFLHDSMKKSIKAGFGPLIQWENLQEKQ